MKLRLLFTLLGAIQMAALFVAFERPAQAYVDPGSGFVFLQIAGSIFAERCLLHAPSLEADRQCDAQIVSSSR
jgi:hypothetical protein